MIRTRENVALDFHIAHLRRGDIPKCTPITLEWRSEYWGTFKNGRLVGEYFYRDYFRLIIRGVYNKVLEGSTEKGPWRGGIPVASVHPDGWTVARTDAMSSQAISLTCGNTHRSQSFRFNKANNRLSTPQNKISLEYWGCLDIFSYPS